MDLEFLNGSNDTAKENATNVNGVAETKEKKDDIDMQGILERSEQAISNNAQSSFSNNQTYNKSFNRSQAYDSLPDDPKEKSLVFLHKGEDNLLRTIEYNRNTAWTDNQGMLMYGENGIEDKTKELGILIDALKSEIDGEKIFKKLAQTPVDWIQVVPVGYGQFDIRKKDTGEVLSRDNAEMTMKMIDTFSKMGRA